MADRFLYRGKAKLAIAEVLGSLDRWIRRSLRGANAGELWAAERSMWKKCRRLAALDSPHKNPSMGARYRTWVDHPLKKYLDQENFLREKELEMDDPRAYWGPIYDLSNQELDEYIIWIKSKSPDVVDRISTEDRIAMWRRERKRTLPILPVRASLPSNGHGGRHSNNREGSGRLHEASNATAQEKIQTPHREAAGTIPFQEQDQEVH